MTIPGRGDLSPRRRYRHGRRRWPRVLITLLVLAALGGAGWYGYDQWLNDDNTATLKTQPTPCPTGHPLSGPTPPPNAPVRVLNGTLRPGLAADVARALHQHEPKVPIAHVGNATKMVKGPSVVHYPADLEVEAWQVAAALSPTAQITKAAGAHMIELDLGTAYRRLATSSEYRTAYEHFRGQATPPPNPAPSACATSSESP